MKQGSIFYTKKIPVMKSSLLPLIKFKTHLKNLQKQRILLFVFFTLFLLNFYANAQVSPATCGAGGTPINCTSNDIRVVSAYISGPNNAPIDCSSGDPFLNAELHLIVSSNTQRIGISIVGTLNILDGSNNVQQSFALANCFTGISINNGSNNNLVYPLGNTLTGTQCLPNFSLSDVFISWGTGNTDFCNGSSNAECPATPAKCRFKPGETIPVTVKLDVDFNFSIGDCQDKTNLTVTLTPTVTAQNITYPLSFDWDLGDGQPHQTTSAASLADVANAGITYTYGSDGTYTITLTVTDASQPTPITKAAKHQITLITCCTLPSDCQDAIYECPTSAQVNTAVFDVTTSRCNKNGTIAWFSDKGLTQPISDPTKIIATDGTIVYGDIANDCGDALASDTLHVYASPSVQGTLTVCKGLTTQLTGSDIPANTGAWQSLNSIATISSTTGTVITVTAVSPGKDTIVYTNINGCTDSVVVIVNDLPSVLGNAPVCVGSTIQLTGSAAPAASAAWQAVNAHATISLTTGLITVVTGVSAGTDTIIYTNANGCVDSVFVNVNPLPTASITVSTQTCTGGVAAFSLTANTDGTSFTWSSSAGADGKFSSTTTSPTTYTPGPLDRKNGVTITLTTTGSNGCTNTATTTLTTSPCGPFYTYTQGYYNSTGTSCTPVGGKKGAANLIAYAIRNMPHDSLGLGLPGHSFSASDKDSARLMAIMPGGGTAGTLGANYNLTSSKNYPPLKNGKISNILLSQAITLALNIAIQGDGLGSFIIQPGYLTTQKGDLSTCPTLQVIHCSKDASAISSVQITTNSKLMAVLSGQTVDSLRRLASKVLGGGPLPAGVSLTDINNAIDVINNAFNGGRFSLGYFPTQQSCTTLPASNAMSVPVAENNVQSKPLISAYPNPFNDQVRFVIQSPVSGKAKLEVFDMLGQKLKTVFDGSVFGGMKQVIEFNVPAENRTNLIYIFRVNDQQVVGKLINIKQ
jgi:hypothetical protein